MAELTKEQKDALDAELALGPPGAPPAIEGPSLPVSGGPDPATTLAGPAPPAPPQLESDLLTELGRPPAYSGGLPTEMDFGNPEDPRRLSEQTLGRARPPQRAEASAYHGSPRDMVLGANQRIAETISAPVEIVNAAMEIAGHEFMRRGDARRAVIAGFRRAGFLPPAAESTWNNVFGRMGSAAVDSLLLLSGQAALTRGGQGSIVLRPGQHPSQAGMGNPTFRDPATGMLGPGAGTPAAARAMVADETALQEAARILSASWLMQPTRTTAMTLGGTALAVPGMDIAGEAGGRMLSPLGPTAERAGRAVGETVGGMTLAIPGAQAADQLTRLAMRGGAATSRAVQRFTRVEGERTRPYGPEVETFPGTPPAAEPIMGREQPVVVQEFIQQQTASEVNRMVQATRLAIRRIAGTGPGERPTPHEAAERFSRELDRLDRVQRGIQRDVWSRVPMNAIVDESAIAPVQRTAANMERELRGRYTEALPEEDIRYIQNLGLELDARGRPIPDPNVEGEFLRAPITLNQVHMIRSGILHRIRVASASVPGGPPPNQALIRNLNTLQDELLTAMGAALPDDFPAMRIAMDVSRTLHDRFTRSALSQLLAETPRGMDRIAGEQAAEALLSGGRMFGAGGPQAVVEAGRPMPGLLTQQETRGLTARGERATSALDDAVRQQFAALAERAARDAQIAGQGPRGQAVAAGGRLQQLFEDYQRQLQPLEAATVNITRQIDNVQAAQERLRTLENSALSRYFGREGLTPERGFMGMLSGSNPAGEVQRVMSQITRGQPPHLWNSRLSLEEQAALRGFQNGVVQEFMRINGTKDFIAAHRAIQSERWQGIFRAALQPDQRERLERIIAVGAQLQERDPRAWGRYGQTFAAHMVGLWGGRIAAATVSGGPAGTLSLPARGAQFTRGWLASLHARTSPDVLVAQAMQDPFVERLLLNIIPGNRDALQRFAAQFPPAIRRMSVAEELLQREWDRAEIERERRRR